MLQTVCLVLLCILCVHATITKLENLLEIHQRVKDDLALYIQKEEQRLSFVKRNLDIFKREHQRAMKDIPGYLGNPINAFTLIKRLTSDLKYLRDNVKIQKANIKRADVQYPSQEDLSGAAQNLGKVLGTYELDVKDLVEGKVKGVSYSTSMTAGDCFELGRLLFKESSYGNIKYAREFLVEAYRKYNDEEDMFYPFTEVDIIEHISMACSKMGDIKSALHWTKVLLEVDPEHSQATEIIAYFQRILASEKKLIESGGQVSSDEEQENSTGLQTTYNALCRGNMDIPAEVSNRLTCYYFSKNHPFLKLAPFKIEMMYLNPDIVFFHDVLSNGEIEAIKKIARLKFTRNTELSYAANDQASSYNHEPNISIWFRDTESDMIARISRRVTDMTGLNVETVKKLNVIKYGFGEDYMPHYDFDSQNRVENASDTCGNKIGTVLFYLSNVALGGASVFPALGLSVFPAKGGAVFWLNVHASGEGDLATLHADCPIVHGSKWVASKWIYECDQELLRPCDGDRHSLVHNFSRPISLVFREKQFYEEYKKVYINAVEVTGSESGSINDNGNNLDKTNPNVKLQ